MGRGRRRRSFRGVALILTRGVARGPFPAVEATGHAPWRKPAVEGDGPLTLVRRGWPINQGRGFFACSRVSTRSEWRHDLPRAEEGSVTGGMIRTSDARSTSEASAEARGARRGGSRVSRVYLACISRGSRVDLACSSRGARVGRRAWGRRAWAAGFGSGVHRDAHSLETCRGGRGGACAGRPPRGASARGASRRRVARRPRRRSRPPREARRTVPSRGGRGMRSAGGASLAVNTLGATGKPRAGRAFHRGHWQLEHRYEL